MTIEEQRIREAILRDKPKTNDAVSREAIVDLMAGRPGAAEELAKKMLATTLLRDATSGGSGTTGDREALTWEEKLALVRHWRQCDMCCGYMGGEAEAALREIEGGRDAEMAQPALYDVWQALVECGSGIAGAVLSNPELQSIYYKLGGRVGRPEHCVDYDGELGTCPAECESGCAGKCGCEACRVAYQDFLSGE